MRILYEYKSWEAMFPESMFPREVDELCPKPILVSAPPFISQIKFVYFREIYWIKIFSSSRERNERKSLVLRQKVCERDILPSYSEANAN